MSENRIPDDDKGSIDSLQDRASLLDFMRESEWIEDKIVEMWENPQEFENGDILSEKPDDADEETYLFFRFAVLAGMEYEHRFPRGSENEW